MIKLTMTVVHYNYDDNNNEMTLTGWDLAKFMFISA